MRHPFALSRRGFLQASAALAAVGRGPASRGLLAAAPRSGPPPEPPPAFPVGIQVAPQVYRNWSGETRVPGVWTATPRTPEDIVLLANWAHAHGWRLRPKGMSHGWSPLLLPHGTPPAGYLLVDGTRHLTAWQIEQSSEPASIRAQTGITLDVLLEQLGRAGLGFAATPAVGDVTLGGVLAVAGHGAALAVLGEQRLPGMSYGSLSNAVLELTAVVWEPWAGRYRLRSFRRGDPAIQPLLVHAGRAFITEAVLQVVPDRSLRCRSFTDIPVAELFAAPAKAGDRSFQNWIRLHGRAEAIWFPFTE
jgi:FAD/FMN-containing dehydrogenase